MANEKPILIVSTSIDEAKSKKELQKQLDSVSKSLKMDTGEKQREKALQYEHKTRLALAKTIESSNKKVASDRDKYERDFQKLLKQEESQMIKIHSQALKINSELGSNREKVLKEEQKTRLAITKITEKEITSEKLKTAEISKQTEKLKLYQAEFERKSSKLMAGQYGSRVDSGALDSLKNQVSGISVDPNNIKASTLQMQQMDSQFKNISTNAQLASRGVKGFGEDISRNVAKFGEWMVASTLFYGVARAIQFGIESVFELDKAVTELRKTTTATEEQIQKFVQSSYDMADALASTNIQVIQATGIFSKMGYTLDIASQLGQLAVKLQTVGDNMGSMEDTANSLVAILKGFGVDENSAVSEVTKRIDQLNAVSNEFAVSTSDLTNGMQRASATMAMSNNTFEQTTALLTAGTEIMQRWEVVSRGLVTISQRIRGVTEDGGTLGLTLEDSFSQLGISLSNVDGSIKSTFDVLSELHSIYPTLTETQRQWIGGLVAGRDQIKVFSSIMQNWNTVSKSMEVQMNSNGSATEELNRKLDSLEGRMNKMINSFANFWNSVIDSELIKTAISLVTVLTDAFATLNNATFGLLLPITLVSVAMAKLFNKNIITGIYETLKGIGLLTTGGYGLSGSFEIATVSMKSFQVSLGLIGIAMVGVSVLFNKYQDDIRKTKDETDKFNVSQQQLKETLTKGDSLSAKTVMELEVLSNKYEQATLKAKEFRAEMLSKGGKQGSSEYNKLQEEIKKIEDRFKELGTTAIKVKSDIDLYNESIKKTNVNNNIATESFDHLNNRLANSRDNYQLLDDAQKEFKENGYLTQDTINAINEKYGKFIDITKLSGDAIIDFIKTNKKAIKERINDDIIQTNSAIDEAKKRINAIKAEMEAYALLTAVKADTAEGLQAEKMYIKGTSVGGALTNLQMVLGELENTKGMLKNSLKELDDVGKEKEKKKSTSTPSIIQDIDLQKERYASLTMALNSVNNELERNKALQEKDIDLASLNKLREDEISILKKKQVAIQNLTKEQQKERNELVKSLNAQGISFSGKEDTAKALNAEKFLNTLIEKMNALKGKSDKASTEMFANLQSRYKTVKEEFDRFAQLQLIDIPKIKLEYEGLDTEINKVATSISTDLTEASEKATKAQQKATEDYVEEAQKIYKELWDYISDKEEERMREYKKTAKKNLAQLDSDLDALEQRYDEANKKLEKDDINKKITELISERNMRSIEGSIDANSRIYEIDKELVDLNKQLAEKERRDIYDKEKKVLENKKEVINSELDLEEEKSQEKLRMYQNFANQKVFIEQNAMNSTVAMLATFDEKFKKDGDTKGQAWLSAFLAKVAMASMYFGGYSGGGGSTTTNTVGSTEGSGGGTGGGNPTAGVTQYATGGVNTYTGLAKLDGTKTLPELVLNPQQIANISGKLGMSGSPSQMARQLYNTAKSTVNNAVQGANVVINQTISAVINNDMDVMSLSKTIATNTSRELVRNGVRL